ncbi:cytochrome P450 [Dendrothele bispora CBS 962.96]|uniref:Cytochrome P450 n=1 Tax=Dendrothele bispora (strain CBS 962.96) TaxID=1314807 RepID=A0A4V4HAQ5_DENBC|nr:cytochrome P450 [Dendrothele bispora CBS 962.96]
MSSFTSAHTTLFIPIFLLYLYHRFVHSPRSRFPLPPGPKGLPIIGSLLDSAIFSNDSNTKSCEPEWKTYLDLGKKFNSDIIHISVLGDHTVVLNSANATDDLLEKRSGIYSDRPGTFSPQFIKAGRNHTIMLTAYHMFLRKMFHQYFQPRSLAKFHPFQRKAVLELLDSLINLSKDGETEFKGPLQRYAGSVILRAIYGITTQEDQEHYVSLVNRAILGIAQAGSHGNFLVDYLSIFEMAWLPGAGFKRKAKAWTQSAVALRDEPWEKLQTSVAAGTALDCLATENLDKAKKDDTQMEVMIRNCTGVAYLGKASLLLSTVLSLLHNPDVQARAQRELDTVVGTSRLPDFGDRENLPYLEAILTESLRIYPVLPLAVPHHSIEDDVYEGYFIPKGTTFVANSWAILHNKHAYPDPLKFNPERFVQKEGEKLPPSPLLYAFGYGRRQCPGRPFALDNAWLAIACILATFNIKKAINQDGTEIEAEIAYTKGMVSHPEDFKCRFVPRSTGAWGRTSN